MKIFRKIFMITWCLAALAVSGCTKGSSVQPQNMVGNGQENDMDESCVLGIISEVDDGEYKISLNFSRNYLIADKCGTDYKKGDSVKVSYAGEIHNYDNNIDKWKEENGKLSINEDYEMYIKADEYKGISLWDNDYSFYGTLEAAYDIRDENGWDGDLVDTYFIFVPLDGEEEGAANEILGDAKGFCGYATQINDGEGTSRGISFHDMRVKITYDPETMLVTKVEPAEKEQAADAQ